MFRQKGVLENFSKFTRKHLCKGLFFNNFASLGPAHLLKKILCHRCFPENFERFPRTSFLQNTPRRLLVYINFLLKDTQIYLLFINHAALFRKVFLCFIFQPGSCVNSFLESQKQPPRRVLKKGSSKNMQQIYRRTPMPKCDFALWQRFSPVNLLHIFRTTFPWNTSGWLLLELLINESCLSVVYYLLLPSFLAGHEH